MFPEDKIIEIFSICDDFSKVFDKTLEQNAITACDSSKKRKYHRDGMMSDSEVMTILILFHDSGYRCLKHFYLQYVCKYMRHLFPKTVSYNRFVELERRAVVKLAILVKSVLMGKCTGISFIDSTPLRVCKNQRILQHKTFRGIAQRGKCSMGWFFGFKLHLICNEKGELLNFMITPGDVDDRKPLEYKENDELKNIAQVEHSRHRCFDNFIVNMLGAIAAYCIFPKKPCINVQRTLDTQLTLF